MGRRPGQNDHGVRKALLEGIKHNHDNMTTKRYDCQGEWVRGMEQGADKMKL